MVKRDPFWVDFDTAVAYKGQMEQKIAEERAMEEAESKSKSKSRLGSHRHGKQPPRRNVEHGGIDNRPLKERLKGAQRINDVVGEGLINV
ncbi:MAG: hypothetical protein GY861_22680 [bacterium]|nr:hypothetical protein [bacterium]